MTDGIFSMINLSGNDTHKHNISKSVKNSSDVQIINFAMSMLGHNEADHSADIFLNGMDSSKISWCAAFVEYVMKNSGDYSNIPDWYKNISENRMTGNKWYCPTVYSAAVNANAIITASEATPGDIVLFDKNNPNTGAKIDGVQDHIGFVYCVDGNDLYTIEGNSKDQVRMEHYNLNDSNYKFTFCEIA